MPRVLNSATTDLGYWGALSNTFSVSGIVWIAVWLGVDLAWRAQPSSLSKRDSWLALPIVAAALIPLAELSWFACSAVAAYGVLTGSGYLWIASPCSSLANVSLAILCWMTLQQLYARRTTLRDLAWGLAACAAVVAINVVRLALLAWFSPSISS